MSINLECRLVCCSLFASLFPKCILFQGEGSVGGAAQDHGQGQERDQGQDLGQGPAQNTVQPPLHVQQSGHPEDSLLDLDHLEPEVSVLPMAPVSSGDESFNPVSSSSHGSHGAVGEVLMPGLVWLYLLIFFL